MADWESPKGSHSRQLPCIHCMERPALENRTDCKECAIKLREALLKAIRELEEADDAPS